MKKTLLTLMTLFVISVVYAQKGKDYKKLPSLGVQFTFTDFKGAQELRNNSLLQVIRNNDLYIFRDMSAGIGISYMQGLSNYVDLNVNLSGSFLRYPVPDAPEQPRDRLLLEGAATANLKLLTDKHCITPFATVGFGAAKYGGYYSAIIPVGLGIQFKIAKELFLQGASQYRIPVTNRADYHLFHSIGIVAPIKKREVVLPPPPPPPVVLDRDNDGVLDSLDRCPDVAGIAALDGCPDRDGDGIADDLDKCPDQAGLAKYGGCPIPDTDGDGINDEEDKCPDVKGYARYQGCPIPDTDGDGVNDEEDKCPTRPGPASNNGCPEIAKTVVEKINFAAKNVFFSSGSFKLLPKSFKSLDEVAKIMKEDETLKIDIDGYTDSQGADDKNQILSENRAASVKDYLISKGVNAERLKATGYGESNPVADNNTAAGRAKNRRTEMTVKNY